jgi:type II secretory pathway pseudopilin PulG
MNIKTNRQAGMSLMEVLIAMSISMVVTASMVALMANSLGTTARIIKMTKLTDDMRIAMQMMTRDVRRSSYNGKSMYCYATSDCREGATVTLTDGSTMVLADDLNIEVDVNGNTCFTFLMDREEDGDSTNFDGDPTIDSGGGFRRAEVDPDGNGNVGVIEMWTGGVAPDCSAAAGTSSWVQITNPENFDIFAFSVDEDLSYTQEIFNDGVTTLSQKVRKVRMNMQGQLVLDPTVVRRIEDVISVRNDILL